MSIRLHAVTKHMISIFVPRSLRHKFSLFALHFKEDERLHFKKSGERPFRSGRKAKTVKKKVRFRMKTEAYRCWIDIYS